MSQRFEDRNKGFMQAVDQESLQAKRNEHVVELRRAKRFDHTRKRRIEMIQIEKPLSIDIQSLHPCLKSISDPCTALECYRKVLVSDCPQDLKLEALNLSRKLISDKPNPDLSFHYSLGFFQIYLSYLDLDYPKSFKIEASWALCNIANGDRFYVQEILNLGMIGKCVEALSVESLDLTENLI